jgi:hypothetical protein
MCKFAPDELRAAEAVGSDSSDIAEFVSIDA